MTIELMPVGVTCNLSCPYCYEHPMREAGNFGPKEYDVDKMLTSLKREGEHFTIFGGEPLLTHIEDLEIIWQYGYQQFGQNNIQSNGCLITDAHIELFKKYNVHVGMSVDGPDELNDTRWAGSLKKTRLMTQKSMDAIDKLCDIGRPPALILTIHRKNGLLKHRQRLKDWLLKLEKQGVRNVRLHTLEVENNQIMDTLALTDQESVEFLLDMWEFGESECQYIRFDLFSDIFKCQNSKDGNATCTLQTCDPYTTHAVQGVDGYGNQNNCGRSNKEGIDFSKADQDGFERNVALYFTPQEHGGCKGCEYWAMCKGYCPGTSLNNDWRNRTLECGQLKIMFGIAEKLMLQQGQVPFSQRPDRKEVEDKMLELMMSGTNTTIETADWLTKAGRGVDDWAREYKFRYKNRGLLNNNLKDANVEHLERLRSLAIMANVDLYQVVPDYDRRMENARDRN